MTLDVVFLTEDLPQSSLEQHVVVVFDVLRATTTMAAALAAGVKQIHVFGSIEQARRAADAFSGPRLLCGEVRCLPPPGFDLGNSPGAFSVQHHAGQTLFMSTTNGTRAIAAARQAGRMYIGALINAAAVARRLVEQHDNIILLCAGTGGRIALEDILGAGAVIHHMQNLSQPGQLTLATDTARIALRLFQSAQHDLGAALRDSQGGRNVMAVNLPEDVEYAARLDQLDVVGEVDRERMVVRRLT